MALASWPRRLKLSVDMDGFFLEAHVKLRPVDFAADGIFMAGMAHYPKFLDESIAQALAAASRAAGILSQKTMLTNARVAVVDPLQVCRLPDLRAHLSLRCAAGEHMRRLALERFWAQPISSQPSVTAAAAAPRNARPRLSS